MHQSWQSIVDTYKTYRGDINSLKVMGPLAEYIAGSQLAKGLFGWTSIWDLNVAQTEVTYPYSGPYLNISPQGNGSIEFRYIDTMDKEKQWHRMTGPDEVIPRLLSFLDQLRWFSTEALAQRPLTLHSTGTPSGARQ